MSGNPRQVAGRTLKDVALTLAGSVKAAQGCRACADTATHTAKPAVAGTSTLKSFGEFMETLDNSASTATTQVMVSLDRQVFARWYENSTGANAVTAAACLYDTNIYWADDHTVTTSSSGNSSAGRCWAVDPVYGVLVQSLDL